MSSDGYAEMKQRELDDEHREYEALPQLAHQIINTIPGLERMGGNQPFDGALEAIQENVNRILGYTPEAEEPEEPKRSRRIPPRLRTAVYERDGYECQSCGIRRDLTIDHIYPFSLGGETVFANLSTLCRPCNASKGDRV